MATLLAVRGGRSARTSTPESRGRMLILSLSGGDPGRDARLLAAPPRSVGAVEVRLDLLPRSSFQGPAPGRWSRPGVARIATCRPLRLGGGFRGSERSRAERLLAALDSGFAMADVEAGTAASRVLLARAPGRVLLSHHDRRRTPPAGRLIALYRRLAANPGVAMVKIVTTARDAVDILEIRTLLRRCGGGRVPLIAFAMGPFGVASRILSGVWGGAGTYVCPEAGTETAPGQLTLPEATETYRISELSASTRLAAIVGGSVSHSLSPLIHNAAYVRLGLDWLYVPLALRRVETFPAVMRALKLAGASVTAPWKGPVFRQLRRADSLSRAAGAVNTVVRDRRGLRGFNTDARGVLVPIRRRLDPAGREVLLLGAGGAARAAAVGLAGAGARVIIAARRLRPGRAAARISRGILVPFREAARRSHEILLNATPVGSKGEALPVPARALKARLVGDMVYRRGDTPLVRAARERGVAAFGGEEVLLAQAVEQFRLFTGRKAPEEVMRRALLRALRPGRHGAG